MGNPFFQAVDPPAVPDPVTPADGPSSPEGWAKVTPPGQGPAPYDICAPQDIAGIAAGLGSANSLAAAGVLYPQGPRQAAAQAFMDSPQGAGAASITAGFPDYENTDVSPGANMANPVQGHTSDYPGTSQDGVPQYGGGEGAGMSGVSPDSGSMTGSAGGDYPGTTQAGVPKYGTS